MADKETGLNITVGAVADEKSAEKAAKDIAKAVDSSIKGGRIDISVPINIDNKQLTKAQKNVVDEIKKITSEGFSASGKDIVELNKKFNKFKSTFKDTGGIQKYSDTFKEIQKQVRSLERRFQKMQNKFNPDLGVQAGEIEFRTKQNKNKQFKGIKNTGPKGYKRNLGYDNGIGTSKTLMDSARGGAHPSGLARQMRISELASVKWMKESLKTWKDETQANLFADNAMTNGIPIKRQIRDKKPNGKIDVRYEDDLYYGSKNKPLTNEQKSKEKANLTSDQLALILGGLEHMRPETSIDAFNKYLEGTMKFGDATNQGYESIFLALNKTFNRYFGNKGYFEVGQDTEKGIGPGHENAQKAIVGMIQTFKKALEKGFADKLVKVGNDVVKVSAEEIRQLKTLAQIDPRVAEREVNRILAGTAVTSTSKSSNTNSQLEKELSELNKTEVAHKKATEVQSSYDRVENAAERTADRIEEKKDQEISQDLDTDLGTGFNTDAKADELIQSIDNGFKNFKELMDPCKDVLQSILTEVQSIAKDGINISDNKHKQKNIENQIDTSTIEILQKVFTPAQKMLSSGVLDILRNSDGTPKGNPIKTYYEGKDIYNEQKIQRLLKQDRERIYSGDISSSKISTTVKDPHSWVTKLKDVFADLTNTTANYKVIMAKTSEEQDKMNAARIKQFGLDRGRNATDTGDKTMIARRLSLFRNKDYFKDLFKDINLSEGVEVDTTKITDRLAKVLSGEQMFKAQTGGWMKNILGAATGGLAFAFQPSLEKSRSRAEGVNQIMANIRNAMNDILQDIQDKESKIKGLKASGDLKLGTDGKVLDSSTTEAKTLVLQLEESKQVLTSILADTGMVDQVVHRTHGRIGGIIKQLGFTSPVLRKNNTILANINAGLDKNGKALKFQTRLAELLNYSFQLMGRHVGQVIKNWLLMLNPINLIKRAFQDFGSYDTKWQRTMNVIKINFQRIIKPFMQWIAQQLVNIIGFFDIISMKIQEAFGQMPISLFDQAGADAEKIHRELEAAANVTAGFDELHDIGSDNSGANDLLGDIYKPQLSEEWKKLAEEIGDLFAGLIKGDLGFGEVMKRILQILWDGLSIIAKAIWDWFKQTAIGKYLTENWKKILATILGLFIAWKLLKIAGTALFNALFGKLLEGSIIKGIFSKLGSWISSGLSALAGKGGILGFIGSFGQGIMMAFQTLFTGGKYSLLGTLKEMFTSHAAITEAGSWGSMIGFAITKALGAALAGAVVAKGFDMVADDASYNMGLTANGGKDKDKKSGLGGKLLGTVGGAALAGLVVGGPIAMGVGAIVGLLVTSLAPAIEEITVKSKEMNNEMQKIEYYEGAVKGAQTEVDGLDEMMNVLNDTLETQTNKVYKVGDELGVSRTRMDELINSVKDGTFHTDMLSGSEVGLTDSLTQLSYQVERNKEVSDKLTEAKKKLQKAELDLAIAQDIEAGNFEMAQARIEYALASELYSGDEAAKKMTQILKKANTEQKAELLQDMSPDLKKKWDNYYLTTESGMDELYKLYDQMSDKDRETWLQNINGEIADNIRGRMETIKQRVQSSSWWQQLLDFNKNGKILGISYIGHDIPGYAVGTNYVPNDGLAYLHQGEAVIPKKYNTPYQQDNSGMEGAIDRLAQQVERIGSRVDQGISVKGQFVQRGSDLVATVEKANNRMKNNVLNNKVYAR